MEYLAYCRFRETHYKNQDFITTIVGIGQVTSETYDSYGVITREISGRDIGTDLECLVGCDGWRRGSTVVGKKERIKKLTKEKYEELITRIR